MHTMSKLLCIPVLISLSGLSFSAPSVLVTNNQTDWASNAYIVRPDGSSFPSIYPTKARWENKVYWNMVKTACHGQTVGNICTALIQMAPNIDMQNPVPIGYLKLDLVTGDITPKQISARGFTLTVDGPGHTTITGKLTQ